MGKPKILAFSGSTRAESYNQKLVSIAAEAAGAAGGEVTLIHLRDFPMPLFDQDAEAASGMPEQAKRLKTLFCEHDALLISAPEYNSSITGVLKNAIDWVSRTETDDEPDLIAYRGKVAALLSASPGGLGGMRGLVHVRSILGNIGVLVLPDQLSVGAAYEAFDESGQLKDAGKMKQVTRIAKALVETTAKLKGA